MGNWARVPWIAILDTRITPTTQRGVYAVYAFAPNMESIHLALGIGTTSSTVEERKHLYQFRDDRADVIVPALHIYTNIMRWADAEEIYVPKIGLADGLIKMLYNERKATS